MPTKLARREAIAKQQPMDPETQAFVNLVFLNILCDPFVNSTILWLAVNNAARQLDIPKDKADKMLEKVTAYHRACQGAMAEFMG